MRAGLGNPDIRPEVDAFPGGGFCIKMEMRPRIEDCCSAHERDMFTGFDRVANFEIGADGPHVHITDRIVFERSIENFGHDDHTATPPAIIGRKGINNPITGSKNLTRKRLFGANGISRAFIEFSEFTGIFACAPYQGNDSICGRINDSSHAIIFFADITDIMAPMSAIIAVVLAQQIAIGIRLSHVFGDRKP